MTTEPLPLPSKSPTQGDLSPEDSSQLEPQRLSEIIVESGRSRCVMLARNSNHPQWAWIEPRGGDSSQLLEGVCPECGVILERFPDDRRRRSWSYCGNCSLYWKVYSTGIRSGKHTDPPRLIYFVRELLR